MHSTSGGPVWGNYIYYPLAYAYLLKNVYIYIFFSFGYIPRMELLYHKVCVCSAIADPTKQFSEVVLPIYS